MPALRDFRQQLTGFVARLTRRELVIAALLVLITTFGAGLRLYGFVERPLWEDEAYTWQDCHVSYGKMLWWKHDPVHGPLSHLLVRLTTDLVGSNEPWVMRLPALVGGIFCIPAAFWLGRTIHSSTLGLLTALCVACDPNMVDQTQQARMYTMLALASMLVLAVAIRLLRNPPADRRPWIGLGVLMSAQFALNYGAIAVWVAVAATGGALAIYHRRSVDGQSIVPPLVRGLKTTFSVALLLSFRGLWRMLQFTLANRGVSGSTAAEKWRGIAESFEQLTCPGLVAVALLLVSVVGLVMLSRRAPMPALLLATTAMLALAMIYGGRAVHHLIAVRYFTVLQPTLWIGLAASVALASRVFLRATASLALVAVLVSMTWQSTHIENWVDVRTWRFVRTAGQFVNTQRQTRDLFTCAPWINVRVLARYYGLLLPDDEQLQGYLYRQESLPDELSGRDTWVIASMYDHDSVEHVRSLLERARAPDHLGINTDATLHLLQDQGLAVIHLTANALELWGYDSQHNCLQPIATGQLASVPEQKR